MDEPVVNASESSANLNSHEVQSIISSEKRERCVMISENAASSSTQKSLSETPSILLAVTPENPSAAAVICLSILYVVPAKAQQPSGE